MRVPRLHRRVERSIDLDRVEKFRQVGSFVKAFGTPRRIHISGPIRIRPAGRPDANLASRRNDRVTPTIPSRVVLGGALRGLRTSGSFWVGLRHRWRLTLALSSQSRGSALNMSTHAPRCAEVPPRDRSTMKSTSFIGKAQRIRYGAGSGMTKESGRTTAGRIASGRHQSHNPVVLLLCAPQQSLASPLISSCSFVPFAFLLEEHFD